MPGFDVFEILEQKFALQLLCEIYQNEGMSINSYAGGKRTKWVRMYDLEAYGLISFTKTGWRNANLVSLTDEGREIAEHILRIGRCLG